MTLKATVVKRTNFVRKTEQFGCPYSSGLSIELPSFHPPPSMQTLRHYVRADIPRRQCRARSSHQGRLHGEACCPVV